MSQRINVLILDSGAGCLSIAKEVSQLLPGIDITCFADIAMQPYGELEDQQLNQRLTQLLDYLIPRVEPNVIVIACNTASTLSLEILRSKYHLPFVGVVPAIKPAAMLSQTGHIGVLATPATINRAYTHNLIKQFASHVKVHLHGSLGLVTSAEQLVAQLPIEQQSLRDEVDILLNMADTPIDVIVLACTHFPLLKEHFSSLPSLKHIHWIDSGKAVAQRVKYWLDQLSPHGYESDREELLLRFSYRHTRCFLSPGGYVDYAKKYFPQNGRQKTIKTLIDNV